MKPGKILKRGGVGILATDTLYGLVCQALDKQAVERIYRLKGRPANKPFIVLINNLYELEIFGICVDQGLKNRLGQYWPGPVSLILPCDQSKYKYLHRGLNSIAFRQPVKTSLRKIIADTGPLAAPSANPSGLPPAASLREAETYFGNKVDFYCGGKVSGRPSKLVSLLPKKAKVLRP